MHDAATRRAGGPTAGKGDHLDRKEFLKSACGLGVCGCALGVFGAASPVVAAAAPAEDQSLAFARYQLAKLLGFMTEGTPAQRCARVLEQTGRVCAKLGQPGARFKGGPEGYFAAAGKNRGTEFAWDKAKGVVTVAVAEGPCGCPLVDQRRTPAVWRNCSVGYQKESFEAIFGRPVRARLKESKLAGAERCVFEVSLS